MTRSRLESDNLRELPLAFFRNFILIRLLDGISAGSYLLAESCELVSYSGSAENYQDNYYYRLVCGERSRSYLELIKSCRQELDNISAEYRGRHVELTAAEGVSAECYRKDSVRSEEHTSELQSR